MSSENFGKIILVGAGPGDPGLLTLKGQKALAGADLIIYDRLANSELLAHAKKNAQFLYVGKDPTDSGDSQTTINQAMIEAAKSGRMLSASREVIHLYLVEVVRNYRRSLKLGFLRK